MKWIVVATALIWSGTALLAIQLSSPLPRKISSGKDSSSSQNIENDSNRGQNKAASLPTKNTKSSTRDEKEGDDITPKNSQGPLIVGVLPKIDIKKDWWDKAYVIFTLVLVIIGGITFGAIVYQARETARAATATKEAAEASRDAAKATQSSAEAIERQVGVMERQTKATEMAAIAARNGAEATQKSVEMFISKERARLRIAMKPLDLSPKSDKIYTVDFTVTAHGATDAYITESSCAAYVLPASVISAPEVADAVMFPLYSMPSVISPNSPSEQYAFLTDDDIESLLREVKEHRMFVGLRGSIKYKDVFDRERETRFRYVWMISLYGDGTFGNWAKAGGDGDNKET